MFQSVLRLSVLTVMMFDTSIVKADSFSLSVNSTTCTLLESKSRRDVRIETYDRASLIAVKKSEYVKKQVGNIEDADYTNIAYQIVDNALKDVVILTTTDDDEKICIEIKGNIDKIKTENIIKQYKETKKPTKEINEIVKDINTIFPESLNNDTKKSIPVYIDDLEYHNHTTTKNYTKEIETQLSFKPNILVTTNKELADYYIKPKILKSSIDVINDNNSKFSMSVEVVLSNSNDESVLKAQKNRYVIIDNNDDTQILAQKMLLKLLKEALIDITDRIDTIKQ